MAEVHNGDEITLTLDSILALCEFKEKYPEFLHEFNEIVLYPSDCQNNSCKDKFNAALRGAELFSWSFNGKIHAIPTFGYFNKFAVFLKKYADIITFLRTLGIHSYEQIIDSCKSRKQTAADYIANVEYLNYLIKNNEESIECIRHNIAKLQQLGAYRVHLINKNDSSLDNLSAYIFDNLQNKVSYSDIIHVMPYIEGNPVEFSNKGATYVIDVAVRDRAVGYTNHISGEITVTSLPFDDSKLPATLDYESIIKPLENMIKEQLPEAKMLGKIYGMVLNENTINQLLIYIGNLLSTNRIPELEEIYNYVLGKYNNMTRKTDETIGNATVAGVDCEPVITQRIRRK